MYTTFLYFLLLGLFYQQTESQFTQVKCVAEVNYSLTGFETFEPSADGLSLVQTPCTICTECGGGLVVKTACTTTSDTVCSFSYTDNLTLRKGQVRIVSFATSDAFSNPCQNCFDSHGLNDLAGCFNDPSFDKFLIYSISDYQPSDRQQQCLASVNTDGAFNLGPWATDNPNQLLGDIFQDDDCNTATTTDTLINYNVKGTCLTAQIGLYFDENAGAGSYLCHYILLYNQSPVCNAAPGNWVESLTQVRGEQCQNQFNSESGIFSAQFELVDSVQLDQRWYKVYNGADCTGTVVGERTTKVYLGTDNCRENTAGKWTIYYDQYGLDCSSFAPTNAPSVPPTVCPSKEPSVIPSVMPTAGPTTFPSTRPSTVPTTLPSQEPTANPSVGPSVLPTKTPSRTPSVMPTTFPSNGPTTMPTTNPSVGPSVDPTTLPSRTPSVMPSVGPTTCPSCEPSATPSTDPTTFPSCNPSVVPTTGPSKRPTPGPVTSLPTTLPTGTPSVTPSVGPSADPSRTPSGLPSVAPTTFPSTPPTVQPSYYPSTMPTARPTSNACAEADPWTIGSELIKVNDAVSVFDDEDETLTVRIEWPLKYNVTKLTFLNANGNLDYTSTNTNGWAFAFDDTDACLNTLSKTFAWSDAAAGGVSLMLNNDDDPPTYTFFVRVEAEELFTKTDSEGNESDETRILILDLPLKLELQDEIELTTDFSVVIDEAMLFDIIEYVAIASTDILERATVNITFTTIMNYPWRLNETSFSLVDTSDVVYDSDPVTLTLTGEDCDDVGYEAECKQNWMIIFTSTGMCGAQGWIDVMMTAEYNDYSESLPVEMLLSLGKGTYFDCANVLGTVGLEGEMNVHDAANKYSSAADATSFYLEDVAYFSATFTTVGPIDDIEVKNVDIQQGGSTACTNCATDAEFELTIDNEGTIHGGSSTNFIHFSLNLAGQYLIGSTTGGVSTKFLITFEVEFAEDPGSGGRRRLLTISVDGSQTETDLNTDQIELASTMNILTSNCGSKIKKGDIRKTACSKKNVHIEICEAAGWKTLVNQCDKKPAESGAVVQEITDVESTSSATNTTFLVACVILIVTALSGLGLYYIQARKTSQYSVQSEKQLNTVIIGETKESQI